MTRLAALMFVAATAIWGLASIPDGGVIDRASPAYRRVELVGTPHRVFVTPTQKSRTSASRAWRLAAMPPKTPSVSE
jgi:hypothetical protein